MDFSVFNYNSDNREHYRQKTSSCRKGFFYGGLKITIEITVPGHMEATEYKKRFSARVEISGQRTLF